MLVGLIIQNESRMNTERFNQELTKRSRSIEEQTDYENKFTTRALSIL